jgi:nitrous oxidase accessory protein
VKKITLLFLIITSFLNANVLQEAIDNAKDGAILKLSAGTYNGNIVINKPISIIGKEDGVIINGGGKGTVVKILSSYVTLKNVTVTNSGKRHDLLDTGILIKEVEHIEVSNNRVVDCLFGIDMQIVHNSIVSNNYIQSIDAELGLRGDGLRVWYSNDNIVSGNELYKSRDMVVWYSHGNRIEYNKGTYGRYSLHFMHAGKNIVKGNVYEMNSVGIFFMFSRDSIIEDNVVKSSLGTTGMGFGLKEVDGFVIRNNTVIYNARGFYIDRSPYEPDSSNLIEGNNILYNTEAMRFHATNINNQILKNKFLGNIDDVVNDTPGSRTHENNFSGNFWDNYEGFDRDNDNMGDTPHKVYQYADKLWLYNPSVKYFYGSPVISLLNFLAKLAPFSEPMFLLEDKKPAIVSKK